MGLRTLPRKTRLTSRVARVSMVVASMLAMPATFLPSVAFAQGAPDAKTSLANGDKAARAKDWPKAVTEFDAANKAQPSADALEGVANAQYQQKHDTEAYAAYDEWVKTYGAKAPKPKTAAVEARLKELRERTGLLSLDVSEPGAAITVDDKPLGTTPLAAPLRLSQGPHRVRVAKDGFVPADLLPNITTTAPTAVTVKLEAQTTKG